MGKFRWQILIVFVALLAIGLLLISQQPSLLPEIAPQIQPASGGVYSEALIGSAGRFNPLLDFHNPADRSVDRLIFSSLIVFDSRGLPVGDLGETWGISQDGKVYNFSLRAHAKWHDGTPVTSADVLFTTDLLRNEQMPIASDLRDFWSQIEVRELDDKTLQFRLPEPFAPFMDYLTFGILPRHILGGLSVEEIIASPSNLKPVGSGPFQFSHLLVENGQIKGVVLTPFQDYYQKVPFVEQVVFRYYPDAQASLEAYRTQDVLGISQVTPNILDEVLKDENLNLYTGRLPRLSLIYLNLSDPRLPFFQSAALRRALASGLNRQKIIDRILGGQGIVAHSPILPESWAYYDAVEKLDYDPEGATEAFRKAEYTVPPDGTYIRAKEGVALSFELVYPQEETYQAIAEMIRSDWQKLGIEVKLKGVDYGELISDYLEPRAYQAALVDINQMRSPDPDPYPFWHQSMATSGQNYGMWDDRLASEYLEQARVEVDFESRVRRYRNFQVRFVTEMPAIPLYFHVYSYAVDDQVQGIQIGPLFDPADRLNTIASWYFVAKRATPTPISPGP